MALQYTSVHAAHLHEDSDFKNILFLFFQILNAAVDRFIKKISFGQYFDMAGNESSVSLARLIMNSASNSLIEDVKKGCVLKNLERMT